LVATTKVAEPLQFVEVFNEQEIRLTFLNANTGDGNPVETETNVSLSDECNLKVSFAERDSELSIRLGYNDRGLKGGKDWWRWKS
jgi:hypothetical protein